MTTTTITVSGMTCGHCVASVTEELSELDGVTDVAVDLHAGADSPVTITSELRARPGGRRGRRRRGGLHPPMSTREAPTRVEDEAVEVRLAISGMTCASCSARIERKLGKVDGIGSATVNLATEKALVSFSAPVTVEQILAEVKKTGYGAQVIGDSPPEPRTPATAPAAPT